jgi:hypothetical protein
MNGTQYYYKIQGLPTAREFNAMPFGRQIDVRRAIEAFKFNSQSTHIRAKGISFAKAMADFKALYKPSEYYAVDTFAPGVWKDDTIEVWYRPAR